MKILVTGGLGFIGANLIRQLLSLEIEVLNVDKSGYASNPIASKILQKNDNYHFKKIDLADFHATYDIVQFYAPNVIIHCAAESHVDNSIDRPDDFFKSNIQGTFNLIEAVRRLEPPNFRSMIYVSTDEVFGHLGNEGIFNLDSQYAPNSPYAASKASSDMMVRAWAKTYGLPFLTTNCSNNYGPFQHSEKMIPKTISHILNKKAVEIYGSGKNVRNWLYVQDHIDCLVELISYTGDEKQFLIGSDVELTNNDLVLKIYDVIHDIDPNTSLQRKYVEDRPAHDFRYSIDYSKTTAELGWQPRVSFDLGIRNTVQYYLDEFRKSDVAYD